MNRYDSFTDSPKKHAYWLVTMAALLYGTVTVGGQFFSTAGFSLYEIALFPLLLTSAVSLPIALIRRKFLLSRSNLSLFVVYGLIGALAELTQFGGISLGISVATVSLLLYSQPLWTCILARLLLKESISTRKIIAIFLTILGVITLVKPRIAVETSIPGVIVALFGGIFIALWIIWGRKSGIDKQHYLTTVAAWSSFSTAWLMILWPIMAFLVKDQNFSRISWEHFARYWLQLATFSILAGILPSVLFFKGLQSVPASIAGVILLLEPVSASILAALFYSQTIDMPIIVGGSLILLANWQLTRSDLDVND